jgi:hypothetical protein
MKYSLIAVLFLFTAMHIDAQNEIDTKFLVNSWKVVSLGENALPTEDFLMIFKFTEEGVLTVGSTYSVRAANYKLENNKISISSEEMVETWEIKKLTADEFVFYEEKTGDVKLVFTTDDLPAVVSPIEEPEFEEPKFEELVINSIETDYQPSKKTQKLMIGTWSVISIGNISAPEGMSLEIILAKEGKFEMLSNGEKNVSGNWKLSEDKKKINISGELNNEVWGIKSLDKSNMVIVVANSGDIVLIRKAVKKKK